MSETYRIIYTADGSPTLYSDEFSESMHTDAGAYEESVVKHILPSCILETDSPGVSVLDVGFGIGYNLCALLCESAKMEKAPFISAVSLEKDRSMQKYLEDITFNDERDNHYKIIRDAFVSGFYENDKVSIRILFGDARQSVRKLREEGFLFDAVFQDAYSPGKNPELWTLDYFKIIRCLMKDKAILTTYSAAPQIRRAMLESGLKIVRGASTGIKKESTLASVSADLDYSDKLFIEELFENVKSTVYRDEKMSASRSEILERRINEMKEIREHRRTFQYCPAPRE
ncbi:MAG: tRNA (5-methylaminomethyl-2-thiouridine)(34)-methyltransferase MnmD [Spirochaetota bacterium]